MCTRLHVQGIGENMKGAIKILQCGCSFAASWASRRFNMRPLVNSLSAVSAVRTNFQCPKIARFIMSAEWDSLRGLCISHERALITYQSQSTLANISQVLPLCLDAPAADFDDAEIRLPAPFRVCM